MSRQRRWKMSLCWLSVSLSETIVLPPESGSDRATSIPFSFGSLPFGAEAVAHCRMSRHFRSTLRAQKKFHGCLPSTRLALMMSAEAGGSRPVQGSSAVVIARHFVFFEVFGEVLPDPGRVHDIGDLLLLKLG